MKNIFKVTCLLIILSGCNFSKSVKKGLISGLTTKGDVLTCADAYLSVNNERTTRNTFNYGEMVYIIFNDMKGFAKENGKVFPSMDILVTGSKGDTALNAKNLYSEYKDGMDFSPLELSADLLVASPIRSGGEYILTATISDKKGPGKFVTTLKFRVTHNDRIKTELTGVTCNEVYLFSQGSDKVILDGRIKFGDNIYFIVEGLKGFKVENGLVFPGMSLKGTDSQNNAILNYDDLLSEYDTSGIQSGDFSSRISSHFKVTGQTFSNPMHCEIVIWDKKSDARIKATTDVTVE